MGSARLPKTHYMKSVPTTKSSYEIRVWLREEFLIDNNYC